MDISASDSDVLLAQFNRLINELLRGTLNRNSFRPWEIELLLDMESCRMSPAGRRDALKRYQRAVQRSFDQGTTRLMKLSEYLAARRQAKTRKAAPASAG